MDTIGGMNVLYFPKNDIVSELRSNPSLLNNKKYMELLAGYFVSEALEKETNICIEVGFPLKKIMKSKRPLKGPSLKEVISNPEITDDSDVDICLGSEKFVFLCQVTRLVSKSRSHSNAEELFNLLDKKFVIQPDERLILIINVEDIVSIEVDRFYDYFDRKEVPYGFIFLVGKREESPGRFQCYQLYPDIKEPVNFDLNIPL